MEMCLDNETRNLIFVVEPYCEFTDEGISVEIGDKFADIPGNIVGTINGNVLEISSEDTDTLREHLAYIPECQIVCEVDYGFESVTLHYGEDRSNQ